MSLASLKSAGDVVAEILMIRATANPSFLLIEGDDDSRFWHPRIDGTQCQVVIGGGKLTVQASIDRADASTMKGILGIVDDDFDTFQGCGYSSPNLLSTDTHDIETMLLASPALDKVLGECGDLSKIHTFQTHERTTVREALIARALVFGNLRWLARRNNWPIPFEERFSTWKFIDQPTWRLKEPELFNAYAAEVVNVLPGDIPGLIAGLPPANPWHVIQGHDAVNILAAGLQTVLGRGGVGEKKLTMALRLAFDDVMCRATSLHGAVQTWQTNNQPYSILR